jgi:tRNA (cytidine/uridine-2'-O-)-methyltransferase
LIVALHEPEIPPNAGNVARLCAATGTSLQLIGRLGFSLRHPDARRAGMDYWDHVDLRRHLTFDDFLADVGQSRIVAFTTKGAVSMWETVFHPDDVLLFGPESRGLAPVIFEAARVHAVRIPMLPGARSLNLATAVGVALYEALRQTGGSRLR